MDYRLAEEIERARRYGRPLAIAVVRPVLLAGERVTAEALKAAAQAADAAARASDLAGWGGEGRLLLIMPETDAQEARVAASRLRDEMWHRSRQVGAQRWEIALLEDITPYETAEQVSEELRVRPAQTEAA
jgi:PleD family two-component response regulator